jgi:hypothetical protein
MPTGTSKPAALNVPALTPLMAKPNWLLAAKYKPVVADPVKDNDGAAAEPFPRVNELIKLEVEV